ncbi:heme ABC transporter permease/ATP-binding protein CydD [Endozoicomonas lisbonensis]|uniref:ATP-binding cassette subfamily C protein CydD n=1 Tax=Endozoicomonas lisbonensis TaxID=3120522 RepID=A0ABV2SMD0_9GAMM
MSSSTNKTAEKAAYRWLLQQVSPARKWLIASVSLGLFSGLLLIVQAALLADSIHKLVMDSVPRTDLTGAMISILLVLLVRSICNWGREVCGFNAGVQVRESIRSALLQKLKRQGPTTIATQPAGSWSTLLVEQVEELHDFVARYLPQMALAALIPLVIVVVAFPLNWVAGLVFLGTAPLIPLFMILVGLKAAEANRRNFQALNRLGGFFLDRLQAMETLRLFQRSAYEKQQLEQASEDFRVKTMQVLRLAFLSSTVLEFFASISIAILALYLGMSFLGYLNFGSYGAGVSLFSGLFLLLLAPDFYQPLRDLGTHYHAKAKAIGACDDIIRVLDQEAISSQQGSQPLPDTGSLSIAVSGLSVDAPGGQNLLSDLSFSVRAGERLAIIGPSGAGKSTLINTLMGFWSYRGQLQVNGCELRDVAPESWRKNIAWLGQQPLIIHGSVYDNVCFGRELSREQVLQALHNAQAMEFIERLPAGIDTLLQEQGGNVSVGQAQRIALARAIAEPVKLLILDEPTASLDALSERLVLDALESIPSDCAVITVTHRLEQIDSMDRVLMLESGKLVAEGVPAELKSGHFPSNDRFSHFVTELEQEQGLAKGLAKGVANG